MIIQMFLKNKRKMINEIIYNKNMEIVNIL